MTRREETSPEPAATGRSQVVEQDAGRDSGAAPARQGPAGQDGRPGFRDVLRQGDFALLWAGKSVSDVGTRLGNVALPLLTVTVLHAGPVLVSLLTTVEFAPWLLVSLPAGALLDRVRLRMPLAGSEATAALLFASVPVAAWLGVLTVAQVLAVAFLAGTATVIIETGKQAYLPRLLPAAALPAGNSVLQTSENAAVLAGPGLGGILIQAAGAAGAILADAASFAVSAGCLAAIRHRESRPERGRSASARSLRADVREGIQFTVRDPYVRPLTLWSAGFNIGFAGWQALLILYLVRTLHASAGVIGLLVAAGGAGMVAGSLAAGPVVRRFGTARVILACAWLATPAALLLPLAAPGPRLFLYAAGAMACYAGMGVSNVIAATWRQTYTPPAMLARATSASWCLLNGVYPPGALLAGGLGAWLGVRTGLWVMLGIMVASGLLLLDGPLRRCRDLPEKPPEPAPAD